MKKFEEDFHDMISKNIRSVLDRRDWSIAELARRSDMNEPTVSRIVNNKNRPQLISLFKIANAFGLSIGDLTK